jgi:hypothetical protein
VPAGVPVPAGAQRVPASLAFAAGVASHAGTIGVAVDGVPVATGVSVPATVPVATTVGVPVWTRVGEAVGVKVAVGVASRSRLTLPDTPPLAALMETAVRAAFCTVMRVAMRPSMPVWPPVGSSTTPVGALKVTFAPPAGLPLVSSTVAVIAAPSFSGAPAVTGTAASVILPIGASGGATMLASVESGLVWPSLSYA